jgi:transcriptional regulator with XRE-family HTH domain
MTQLESRLQKDDSMNFSEDSQMSTNLNSKKSLVRRLRKGRHVRTRFVESHLDKKLAFQIRSLRGDLSQQEMEQKTGIKQQAISRLENPYYGKATLTTLKKIAAANDVGLLVEFVPYSELINRVSGTPYVERGYRPETMNVPSFDEEDKNNAFDAQDSISNSLDKLNAQVKQRQAAPPNGLSEQGNGPEMTFEFPKSPQGKTSFWPFPLTPGMGSLQNKIDMGATNERGS